MTPLGVAIAFGAFLAWCAACALLIASIGKATSGEHPGPASRGERPSLGADVSDDEEEPPAP